MIVFHTKTFEHEGAAATRLPPDSGIAPGDEVLIFKVGADLHLLPTTAPEQDKEELRRVASKEVTVTAFAV